MDGSRFLAVNGFLFHVSNDFAMFKMQGILKTVTANRDIHIFRRILRGARAQAV